MRRIVIALSTAVVLGAVAAPPALAEVKVSLDSVKLAPAKAGKKTSATVTATIAQRDYADISLDLALSGFTAQGTFAFGEGACPARLIRISAPAEIVQCGWVQQDKGALLSLALAGTFPASTIRISVRRSALTSPAGAGEYGVTLSSWAFEPVRTKVTVR